MSHEISPGIERANATALRWAAEQGVVQLRLTDWLLGLIEEEEGKPAVVLEQLGVSITRLRDQLSTPGHFQPVLAPSNPVLFSIAREKAVFLRSDSTLTTDAMLLAILDVNETFTAQLAELGVTVAQLEVLLTTHRTATHDIIDAAGPVFVVPEPTDLVDAGRIVDVNMNRAREALRILDDYCRFVLNDAFLTKTVKQLRHDLVSVASILPAQTLLGSRDTTADVGTSITTKSEATRQNAKQVAAINAKRLQESLRSVEEYGKIFGPEFAKAIEAIRYRAYTLERILVVGAEVRRRLAHATVYALLTGSQCVAALDWTIAEAAEGGVSIVQLREKSLTDRDLLERAKNVRRWTREAGVLFIVNDRPDIAKLCDADGVHLGQDDLPVAAARRILGPDALIGVSTHNLTQVRQAIHDGADYLGIGPTFPSATKSFDNFPGLDFIQAVSDETTIPAFALGGINLTNIHEVVAAGGKRVAVSSLIAQADDPRSAAMQLRFAITS